jgi:hypothetical protein
VTNAIELEKVSLWHNEKITDARKKPLFMHGLNKKGIKTVGQLFNQDGEMIASTRIGEIGLTRLLELEWIGICRAIPREWKESIKNARQNRPNQRLEEMVMNKDNVHVSFEGSEVNIQSLTQRKCTEIIVKCLNPGPNPFATRMTERLNLEKSDWDHLYKLIKKWSNATYNRNFAWRWVNGIFCDNKMYAKIKVKPSAKCTFCDHPMQNQEHLLFDCNAINEFRDRVFTKYHNMFSNKNINERLKIFGCLDKGPIKDCYSDACDVIILLMNMYIFNCNYSGTLLNMPEFSSRIHSMERTEYAIAEEAGKLHQHLVKWETIGGALGYSVLMPLQT